MNLFWVFLDIERRDTWQRTMKTEIEGRGKEIIKILISPFCLYIYIYIYIYIYVLTYLDLIFSKMDFLLLIQLATTMRFFWLDYFCHVCVKQRVLQFWEATREGWHVACTNATTLWHRPNVHSHSHRDYNSKLKRKQV